MARDYYNLGSSPTEEDCAQVGSDDYYERMRAELEQLRRMMQEIHPSIPLTAYAIKAFPHDFGTYHELCAIFDDDYPETVAWMLEAERLMPDNWDEEARAALAKYLQPTG